MEHAQGALLQRAEQGGEGTPVQGEIAGAFGLQREVRQEGGDRAALLQGYARPLTEALGRGIPVDQLLPDEKHRLGVGVKQRRPGKKKRLHLWPRFPQ